MATLCAHCCLVPLNLRLRSKRVPAFRQSTKRIRTSVTGAQFVFTKRRLAPGRFLRVVLYAVVSACRLYHAVFKKPMTRGGPDASGGSGLEEGESTELASRSGSKRRSKQSADRMLPAPERAPIGTDGLGYNVGLGRGMQKMPKSD